MDAENSNEQRKLPVLELQLDTAEDRLDIKLENCTLERALDMLGRAARNIELRWRTETIFKMQQQAAEQLHAQQIAANLRRQ